jgi:hypothetical protein
VRGRRWTGLRGVAARLKGAGNVAASGDVFIEAIFCAGFEIEREGAHSWVNCQGEEEGEESESEAHGAGDVLRRDKECDGNCAGGVSL